ncbi:SIS domain-containing protein [Clostridium cadaveris]|uniref:SIS domain-containing protein n=1 Tax=Clostridium cadaveris TaxID=1529 RepID=UPI0003FD1025|nr:SIS domain-containing protein [Clostridium cadaveris]MDY4950461.1 SIS domain-containing protein [Clostridium cadaveris]
MNIFNINEEEMKNTSSTFTLNEIYQQPKTWKKTCDQIKENKEPIQKFINQVITCEDYDVIFTGAGTSEFVGNSLYSYLNKLLNYKVKSYATTDIVASPETYLSKTKPTLLISFGRSGNSPESIGAVDAAEAVCDNLYNLFITCNKNGALSKISEEAKHCYAINLTDETHDQSFAMTSSFTNMYLAAYLIFNLDSIDDKVFTINKICAAAQDFLDNNYKVVKQIVDEYDFQRIVYLGSNVLKGISQESSLKMLELTAGNVVTMYDTPLGFRHGPKSIIDDTTLIVVYVSDDEYTRKYELDLIKEISNQRKRNKIVVVYNEQCESINTLADYSFSYNIGCTLNNIELGLGYIIFAQTLAVLKSLSIGLTPDNPCPSGEVNRVVKGVTLYPYISIT